ncbi:MAG: hypothetical protein AMS27_10900 [Bacteroides sp. SM23_62_1]|nr:MAG: hypothetical protein AMS27_10900 [Bacteroides sp. SM23_62_1]
MAVIGLDLGGTKLSAAIFNQDGMASAKTVENLNNRRGKEVGQMIIHQVTRFLEDIRRDNMHINAIGISVPGIFYPITGRVWANNIPGWDDYPLLDDIARAIHDPEIKICIDNDRSCCVLGETWMGKARGCRDVVFLLIGTGIGAGIMVNGQIVGGSTGAAGAAGWLALDRPYKPTYLSCGCFEYHASGKGIVKVAKEYLREDKSYNGVLKEIEQENITSEQIFSAFSQGDPIAKKTLQRAIEYWGMAIANIVSMFNPEKIILGGGLFGPGLQFLNNIVDEAQKWAQPVSIKHVQIDGSALGNDTALFGAGYLALQALNKL